MINKINFFPVSNYYSNGNINHKNISFTSNPVKYGSDKFEKSVENKKQNAIAFKGHIFRTRNFLKPLNNETRFFRDEKSCEFLRNYILENMSDKDKINIVSAGCSSGEEAITFSMLLDPIKDKVHILGFDLSKEAIKQAKSGIYTMQDYIDKEDKQEYHEDCGYVPEYNPRNFTAFDKDSYLISDTQDDISSKQAEYRELFQDFFERTQETQQSENNIVTSTYQLKPGKADNCEFLCGNIKDIDKIVKKNINGKADVILFKNAIYHFLRKTILGTMLEINRKDAKEICKNIVEKMDKSLNDNGIICFGEDEPNQLLGWEDIVPLVMQEMGYVPLNNSINIWQKVGNKNQ